MQMRRTYWRREDGTYFAKDVDVTVTAHFINGCEAIHMEAFEAGVMERFSAGGAKRVVAFGGRDYSDRAVVFGALDDFHRDIGIAALIEGGAHGADRLAQMWAKRNGIVLETYEADWDDISHPEAVITRVNRRGKVYNPLAGFIRNQQMIDDGKPDCGIAFPGGRGTADMRDRCIVAGIPVFDIGDSFENTSSP